jgi:hypothetical protein
MPGYSAKDLRTDAGRYARPVKRTERRVVVGVEADHEELKTWGRAAQIRRLELDAWIRKTLSAAAVQDEQRSSPR